MASEGSRLAVICELDSRIVKGTIIVGAGNRVADLVNRQSSQGEFLSLADASVFDGDRRLLSRHTFLTLNRRYVRYIVEDERAPVMAKVKQLLSIEDYEHALEEVDYLLGNFGRDADAHYIAGVAFEGNDDIDKAKEHFKQALGMAVDEVFQNMINRHLAELE